MLCKCNREKILYICKDGKCPEYKRQAYYCQKCANEGMHKHSDHTHHYCSDIIDKLDKDWSNLKEMCFSIFENATKSYEKMRPLIIYFEAVPKEQKITDSNKTKRVITNDYDKLRDAKESTAKFYNKVEKIKEYGFIGEVD